MKANGIVVIEQTTTERKEETRQLFEKIKPLLDKGYSYRKAVCMVLNRKENSFNTHQAWYRDVIEYGETQGYSRKDYVCRRMV